MGLTLEFIPYSQIEGLTSVGRIRRLLNTAKEGKIVLLQGRLKKIEESELIQATMEEINHQFKGIELAVINPQGGADLTGFKKFRNGFASMLLGNRQGMTILGPASIVKQIKKDPDKIELYTKEARKVRRRRR